MKWAAALAAIALTFVAGACSGEGGGVAQVAEPIKPSPPYYGDPQNGAVFAIDISHWEGPMAQAEMDCFWASGVRHVVSGTQVEAITRQQLAMAVSRGMTIDAYVYLYWDRDVGEQVDEAFRRVAGFPIGRMWLDVEQDPGGASLIPLVQQAVARCQSKGSAECGIYTGPGFWRGEMGDTSAFSTLPLWYAWYNHNRELSFWPQETFGGWAKPVAKQWAEEVLCSVGVDKDTMQVLTKPMHVIDRTLPPAPTQPPSAPSGLYPTHGSVSLLDYVKLMVAPIPHATSYQLALERWTGSKWIGYYTWSAADGFRKVFPKPVGSVYRFRARANNALGWGAWSGWSVFDHGKLLGPRPPEGTPPADAGVPATGQPDSGSRPTPDQGASPDTASAPDAGPQPDTTTSPDLGAPDSTPQPAGAPTGLAPDVTSVATSAVALSCDPLAGATQYQFAIEFKNAAGSYAPYVTYTTTSPQKTFYPTVHKTSYRHRVRAKVAGAFGPWSNDATFDFE